MIRFLLYLLFILFSSDLFASEKIIAVTILPQKFITEKIAGNEWKVVSVIPEGANPHTFEPKFSQMKEIATAKAYLSLESSLDELWLKRLLTTNKNLKIYRMDIGIDKLEMIHEDHHGHGKHKHKLFHDPHIWLSFDNMIIIANNTKKALLELDPSNKVYYENNYESLIEEIIKIKNKAKDELKFRKDKSFLVFHPSWGYLAKEFSLNQIAIEVEGKEPSPKEMKTIIDTARSKGINVIFIQPQISTKTVDTLSKELNATIIKINPLEYNWLNNMKYVLDNIAKGLK